MKVYADRREVVLSRENIERLLYMLDHPEEHAESWCGKSGWRVIAQENEQHYPVRGTEEAGA